MNIQIFGTKKCNDTKKAERFFKGHRRDGVGSKLVAAVENAYKGKGYEKIALTTFGFQAPEFYKNLDMNWSLSARTMIQSLASIFI